MWLFVADCADPAKSACCSGLGAPAAPFIRASTSRDKPGDPMRPVLSSRAKPRHRQRVRCWRFHVRRTHRSLGRGGQGVRGRRGAGKRGALRRRLSHDERSTHLELSDNARRRAPRRRLVLALGFCFRGKGRRRHKGSSERGADAPASVSESADAMWSGRARENASNSVESRAQSSSPQSLAAMSAHACGPCNGRGVREAGACAAWSDIRP